MTLIPDWRDAWRLWSARLSALGTLLYGAALAWPDGALMLWNMMPAEVRAFVPEPIGTVVAFLLFAAVLVARLIPQKTKEPTDG